MALVHTLARLRHLTLREIPFRVEQQIRNRVEPFVRPTAIAAGEQPRWPVAVDPSALSLEGQPSALGYEGIDPLDWQREPTTGRRWPMAPSHRIDVLGTNIDPRFCWEWSRLQHAALWAERKDPRGEAHARAWIEDNPVGWGLGWASALEAALRLVSLVRIGSHSDAPWLRSAIADHAAFIAAHPSRGSSVGNHRVAELSALVLAGYALGDPRWNDQTHELAPVLDSQIHPDGVGVEQSLGYLAFDIEWALLARLCGLRDLDPILIRATRFLTAVLPPSGCAPDIGDNDDGRVVPITFDREEHYVRSVTGASACALGIPIPASYRPDQRASRLGISGALPPTYTAASRSFPDGGLTVLVSDDLHLVFDHGPLGGCVLAAHGHADALSVWIDYGGPVICARGTGVYNADPPMRRFHRGSSAHPTLIVDGRDQSAQHGYADTAHPFLWTSRAQTTLLRTDLASGVAIARCRHATAPVTHTRTVRLSNHTITLDDEIAATGRHHIAAHFPLAPDITVGPDLVLSRAGTAIGRLHPDPGCTVSVIRGGARPGLGWHAPRYGHWVEASAIVCERHARTEAALRTVLAFW